MYNPYPISQIRNVQAPTYMYNEEKIDPSIYTSPEKTKKNKAKSSVEVLIP